MADRVSTKDKKINATQDSVEGVGILDSNGNLINPGSEETLIQILSSLGGGAFITRVAVDSVVGTTTYIGSAVPTSATSAAVWQIIRLQAASGLQTGYAGGNALYNKIWDNRESLNYS